MRNTPVLSWRTLVDAAGFHGGPSPSISFMLEASGLDPVLPRAAEAAARRAERALRRGDGSSSSDVSSEAESSEPEHGSRAASRDWSPQRAASTIRKIGHREPAARRTSDSLSGASRSNSEDSNSALEKAFGKVRSRSADAGAHGSTLRDTRPTKKMVLTVGAPLGKTSGRASGDDFGLAAETREISPERGTRRAGRRSSDAVGPDYGRLRPASARSPAAVPAPVLPDLDGLASARQAKKLLTQQHALAELTVGMQKQLESLSKAVDSLHKVGAPYQWSFCQPNLPIISLSRTRLGGPRRCYVQNSSKICKDAVGALSNQMPSDYLGS